MKITSIKSHVLRYELEKELGYSQQYYKHRLGKNGLNWVIKYRDSTDLRKQVMKLSPQGVLLVKQLRDILYG